MSPAIVVAAILGAGGVFSSGADAIPDDQIREKILRRLSGQVALHLEQFQLEVHEGRVGMEGTVASLAEVRRLERIVSSISGVRGISSRVTVRPADRPDPVLLDEVRRLLYRRPRFRGGVVEAAVAGTVVTLTGRVERGSDRLEAVEAAEEVPGITGVVSQIEVLIPAGADEESIRRQVVAVLANPLTFGVIRDLQVEVAGGLVTLKGSVARELDRREAERLALTVAGVREVQNELTMR